MTSRAAITSATCALSAGCSAPPWQIGRPLDGRPSIPPTEARPTPRRGATDGRTRPRGRRAGDRARRAGDAGADVEARCRVARPADGRRGGAARRVALPAGRDVSHPRPADPREPRPRGGGPSRSGARRQARSRSAPRPPLPPATAGSAIDAPAEAREAFTLAARLGGVPPDAPPPTPAPLIPANVPPDIERWVLGGPTLSGRLLPLAAARPAILDDVPRALRWADAPARGRPDVARRCWSWWR